jgi:hypothetical protein
MVIHTGQRKLTQTNRGTETRTENNKRYTTWSRFPQGKLVNTGSAEVRDSELQGTSAGKLTPNFPKKRDRYIATRQTRRHTEAYTERNTNEA